MTMKSSVASRLFTFHSNCSSVLYIYFISVPRETDILAENHDFFILPAFHAAIRGGGPCGNIAIPFGKEKLGWCGYRAVKKV